MDVPIIIKFLVNRVSDSYIDIEYKEEQLHRANLAFKDYCNELGFMIFREKSDYEISYCWGCKDNSHGDFCIYDIIGDPAKDECLFCGGPEERK